MIDNAKIIARFRAGDSIACIALDPADGDPPLFKDRIYHVEAAIRSALPPVETIAVCPVCCSDRIGKPGIVAGMMCPSCQFRNGSGTRSCNRHDDCNAAEAEWRRSHPGEWLPANLHCHDDCCEDCFGS